MSHLSPGPLMVDIEGTQPDRQECRRLQHPAVGGVILFSRNFESREQLRALCREIKSLCRPELLIAVDQEGGRVQRFRSDFTRLPACLRFGRNYAESPEQSRIYAYSSGLVMATELVRCGIDFSFAPVLDTASMNSEVIGNRGFHSDAQVICDLARHYIMGMNDAGVSATGKHFPGHGGVCEDSHCDLPRDYRTLNELEALDLIPYRALAPLLGGVMTAHVSYPRIDRALPTYSAYWIGDILRCDIGFCGAVFSDDLTMRGATEIGDIEVRVCAALDAGCDMALICNNPMLADQAVHGLPEKYLPGSQRLERMRAQPAAPDAARLAHARTTLEAQRESIS